MSYSSHLGTGTTTLCRCFRLIRTDGVVFGFTDHDADVDASALGVTAASNPAEIDTPAPINPLYQSGDEQDPEPGAGLETLIISTTPTGLAPASGDEPDDLPAGIVLGQFEGVRYRASAALTASEAAATLGLAPDELDASGALTDDAITEADLKVGVYDGATIEVFDVNWADPTERKLLGRFRVGEVERTGIAFRAELRSLAATLEQPKGRLHTTLCDVKRLGDHRCGLDLAPFQGQGVVISASGAEVTVSGLDGFASGLFDRGILAWKTGANSGAQADIRVSRAGDGGVLLSLWRLPQKAVRAGDTLTVTAGCDKTAATCEDRFSNLVNFRGFPHMPGETYVGEYAVAGDPNQTGGSRFD